MNDTLGQTSSERINQEARKISGQFAADYICKTYDISEKELLTLIDKKTVN